MPRNLSKPLLAVATITVFSACLIGCADLGYYAQAVRGQMSLLGGARDIDELLQDPKSSAALRERLASSQKIRNFASQELGLPDNASYRRYVALPRPFALWNVVATPELSLQAKTWCFPIAGCVSYRGYYDEAEARAFAAQLRSEGYDVQVSGVPAYSTLGWFSDPLLSSFAGYSDPDLARLMFHELAHQVVYLSGDSQFNESFATTVENAGLARWLACVGSDTQRLNVNSAQVRQQQFLALLRQQRSALQSAYRDLPNDDAKRAAKQEILSQLHSKYAELKQSWAGFAGYDRWFSAPVGNAHLAAVATYHEYVPAFTTLLRQQSQFSDFYSQAKILAEQPAEIRQRTLQQLANQQLTPNQLELGPCNQKSLQ